MVEKILKICVVLVSMLLLALVAWGQFKAFLDGYFQRQTVKVPHVTGLALNRVLQDPTCPLKIRISRELFHDQYPQGYIIAQDPPGGANARKDGTIYVKVSKGSDFREVPDVLGLNLRKARLHIQKAQLRIGRLCYIRNSDVERGKVLVQYPHKNERLGKRAPVDLLLSDGHREKLITMPRVLGESREVALTVLESIGVTRVNVIERPTTGDMVGLIIGQRPVGGIQIPLDQNVVITVSSPAGDGANQKSLKLTYQVPPGLTEKLLEIVAADSHERSVVYKKRHMPGETARVTISGKGTIAVQYFLDKVLVKEESY